MTNRDPMQVALEAAQRALGRTSPNPPVGAVVVKDGQVIAQGWTQPPGGAHAEVMALREAGEAARGADLYVTLEPCTIWGRTPPCTDAIIAAGIARVVIASRDPNPRFEHDAPSILYAAGIDVTFAEAARAHAEEQTEAFRHWITTRRPFVHVKYAMTLDGKIAARTGDSRWITSPPARAFVHQQRDQLDAILVGVGTVLADDPLLTTRIDDHWRSVQHPLRIVLDSRGRTPATAQMLQPDTPGKTLILATEAATEAWRSSIPAPHEVVLVPSNELGRIDLQAALTILGERDLTSLMVEGGAEVIASFVEAKLVNKLQVWIAPKLIGGAGAPTPVGGAGRARMADADQFVFHRWEQIGPDLLAIAYPTNLGVDSI